MKKTPTSTLAVLITCSRDQTRGEMAREVMKNLRVQIPLAGLSDSFIVFDNGSLYREHLDFAPPGATILESKKNVGYWSAINFVLSNYETYIKRRFEFIYLIESDLIHHDLDRLSECEIFLRRHSEASCVRTQEFSVAMRWRYSKALQLLPFHVRRSQVNLFNAVSKERAWFKKADGGSKIYLSNLHAKLPALNRIDLMRQTFARLSTLEEFSEGDFFAEMFRTHSHIGVYDGGLYHSIFDRKSHLSGSYSSDREMKEIDYLPTRQAKIVSMDTAPLLRTV